MFFLILYLVILESKLFVIYGFLICYLCGVIVIFGSEKLTENKYHKYLPEDNILCGMKLILVIPLLFEFL